MSLLFCFSIFYPASWRVCGALDGFCYDTVPSHTLRNRDGAMDQRELGNSRTSWSRATAPVTVFLLPALYV